MINISLTQLHQQEYAENRGFVNKNNAGIIFAFSSQEEHVIRTDRHY